MKYDDLKPGMLVKAGYINPHYYLILPYGAGYLGLYTMTMGTYQTIDIEDYGKKLEDIKEHEFLEVYDLPVTGNLLGVDWFHPVKRKMIWKIPS